MKINKQSNVSKKLEPKASARETSRTSSGLKELIEDVKNEINFVRTNLKEYINKLLYWKAYLKAKKLSVPKKPTITLKDTSNYDELIIYLKSKLSHSASLIKLEVEEKLSLSAKSFIDLLKSVEGSKEFSKVLTDKNGFVARLKQYGNPTGLVGESVNMNDSDAEMIVLRLLLGEDDVNKTDREIFLNKSMHYLGIAVGVLTKSGSNIIVIDFCENIEPKPEEPPSTNSNRYAQLKRYQSSLCLSSDRSQQPPLSSTPLSFNLSNHKQSRSLVIEAINKDYTPPEKTRHRQLNISVENIDKSTKLADKVCKLSPITSTTNKQLKGNTSVKCSFNPNSSMATSKNSNDTTMTNDTLQQSTDRIFQKGLIAQTLNSKHLSASLVKPDRARMVNVRRFLAGEAITEEIPFKK